MLHNLLLITIIWLQSFNCNDSFFQLKLRATQAAFQDEIQILNSSKDIFFVLIFGCTDNIQQMVNLQSKTVIPGNQQQENCTEIDVDDLHVVVDWCSSPDVP